MADETISTRIVANADFSALIADVHRVTASLSKLQQELASSNKMLANQIAVMNRSFSDTLRSTGQYSTHFVSLQSDVEKFGKNLDGGKLKLNQYFNTFRDQARTSGGLIRDLAKQQVSLQNSILQPLGRNAQGLMQFNVHVPRGLDEIKNKTAIAKQELQIMNKVIQDGAGQLINWGKNTQWAGRQLTVGLTVPLVAFGKAAADAFKQADQELVRLTKVYGDVAGTSAAELGKVRDDVTKTAKEISAAMGVSFKETIGLAADIAATGKTGDELLGSIKETTRLAVLGEVDRQEAMKATLAIQSAFKQNTDELSKSINFLNAVENQTSTTLNDLVEAIPKAGPVIQGLGGSVQDLALYLTAMREGGINASEGANALKSALASLINPTDVAVGKFQTLGIDLLGIVNNNAGDLTGTLMTLQAALDNLDPLKKQQAIEQLFGKFQFARLNALFENLGRQGSQTLQVLDLMKSSSEDLAAVAGRELLAVTESASGKYRREIESLRASLAEVGEQFLQINTVLIQVINKVVEFANNLPQPIKQVLALAGGFTAVIGPVIMLTGVLANFFGYILKGVFHMKAFFKGGEGWKYLTPEMLAAEKAGRLVEQSFYSDAKAAAVLKQALGNLIDEFSILEAKAKSGATSINPAVSTMAGNLVMSAGGQRIVDPSHPLAGTMGTRASSHMVPRSGMTDTQRVQQTMFGMVPGSIPVNQRIGQNPQIYMNEPLPNVSGLTTVKGTSTGIVAGEAARWHAMMATLGMQSKAEIENLKRTIAATGTVSKEFMTQFDDILPAVNVLTNNAAKESALIVAELRAGKINLDAARAKIVALNLETERLIAATVQAQATAMGRTINPTMVPTLNQPVVDPTGKSNMRELFKKGKTKDFINKVAGTLGVRTSGAGYNIETTKPRKFEMGGVQIQKYAGGYTSLNAALQAAKMLRAFSKRSSQIGGVKLASRRSPRTGAEATAGESYGEMYKRKSSIYSNPEYQAYGITPTQKLPGADNEFLVHGMVPGFLKRTKGLDQQGSGPLLNQSQYEKYALNLSAKTSQHKSLQVLPTQFIKNRQGFNDQLRAGSATAADFRPVQGSDMVSLLLFLKSQGVKPTTAKQIADRAADVLNQKIAAYPGPINEATFGKLLNNASVRAISSGFRPSMVRQINPLGSDMHSRNMGLVPAKYQEGVTKLPGYGGGDIVPALLEPGESVVTKKGTRGNEGTLHLINAGYNVDRMVGFKDGVVGVNFKEGFSSSRNKNRGSEVGGGMSPMASTGMFMGGMGLSMAGSSVGGTAGMLMSSAGMAMQFLPMLTGLKGLMSGITKVTALAKTFGSIAGTVFRIAGTAVKFFTGPIGLAVLAVTGLVAAFKFWKKGIEETKKEQTSLYGMSEKGAKELGIAYTSVTDKMKALKEEQKLAADKAKSYFESYSMAGGGLTLTIKQLKELKERVKTDMPDTLSILNNIDSSKVNDWAANLKAQMISSGKTVEESTNLIYALIEASNKAGQGVGAISNKLFSGISDQGSAADFVLKNLVKNITDISQIDPSAFASNVDSTIASLDSAVKSLIGTKDASGKTINEAEAIAIQFERMANAKIKDNKLGKETLSVLKSQRPELANILNQSDTIGGMYAKWRLFLQGVKIDLQNINSSQAETLSSFTAGLDAASAQATAENGTVKGLEEARKNLSELQKQYKAAQTSSNTDKINSSGLSKKQIKAIQDEIKAIKERAEAKKKALREVFDIENSELELQKAKLELQNAVARGDNEAMAAAQIRIQQIQKESSLKAAELKIDENAKKAEEKQQKILEKDAAYKDALSESAAKQGKRAENIQGTISEISNIAATLGRVAKLQKFAESDTATKQEKEDFKTAFANALNDIVKSAKSNPKVLESFGQFLERKDTGKKDKQGNIVYEYKKDDKGNFIPGKTNEEYLRRTGGRGEIPAALIPEGSALTELKQLSTSMSDFATKITGGTTLAQIYDILAKGSPKGKEITIEMLEKALSSGKYNKYLDTGSVADMQKTGFFNKDGSLKDNARELAIRSQELQANEKFNIGKFSYNVKTGYDSNWKNPSAVRMSMGGYIKRAVTGITGMTSSQPYLVGERGPELFVPSSGGQIIPNNLIGPKYDVGSGVLNSVPKGSVNSSFNNNVYNIDIDLNGTNVTADDILRKFKSELALIGAKEGRVRTLGGEY